jgi:hypothetical protein
MQNVPSQPLASTSPSISPNVSNTPVVPMTTQSDQQAPPAQENSIVLPPPPAAPTTESKPAPTSNAAGSDTVDPCCSNTAAIGFLALGLIMFLIFVTIAGSLGQSDTAFCEGYVSLFTLVIYSVISLFSYFLMCWQWRLSPKYQFSGHVRSNTISKN